MFGLKEDIEDYYLATKLVNEPEFTNHFADDNLNNPYYPSKFKYATEQYYGFSWASRHIPSLNMQDASCVNDELMSIYLSILENNFIVLNYKCAGIYLSKYRFSKFEYFIGEQYLGLVLPKVINTLRFYKVGIINFDSNLFSLETKIIFFRLLNQSYRLFYAHSKITIKLIRIFYYMPTLIFKLLWSVLKDLADRLLY